MRIDEKELNFALAEHPTQTVAMVAAQAIGELSAVMDAAGAHDDASRSLVTGLCAWLTSVLDGKDSAPGLALVGAAKVLEKSLLEEVDRCQHFVAELNERTRKAESEALVNKQYADWYLRLRDGDSGDAYTATGMHDYGDFKHVSGDELDAIMEDLDEPEPDPEPDPGNDIDKPE